MICECIYDIFFGNIEYPNSCFKNIIWIFFCVAKTKQNLQQALYHGGPRRGVLRVPEAHFLVLKRTTADGGQPMTDSLHANHNKKYLLSIRNIK